MEREKRMHHESPRSYIEIDTDNPDTNHDIVINSLIKIGSKRQFFARMWVSPSDPFSPPLFFSLFFRSAAPEQHDSRSTSDTWQSVNARSCSQLDSTVWPLVVSCARPCHRRLVDHGSGYGAHKAASHIRALYLPTAYRYARSPQNRK